MRGKAQLGLPAGVLSLSSLVPAAPVRNEGLFSASRGPGPRRHPWCSAGKTLDLHCVIPRGLTWQLITSNVAGVTEKLNCNVRLLLTPFTLNTAGG